MTKKLKVPNFALFSFLFVTNYFSSFFLFSLTFSREIFFLIFFITGASEKLGLYEYMGQEKTKTANKEESDSEEESYGSEDDEPQQTSSGFGGFGYGFNVNAI